jgi:hypothetical protein
MPERFRPDPDEYEACVRLLCTKIETIALRSGAMVGDCSDLDGMLAAMPPEIRGRTALMLNAADIQAEYNDPTMALAARYLLRLARGIWDENPHPITHEPEPSFLPKAK